MKRCLHCMNEYPEEYGSHCPSCGYIDGTTQDGSISLQPGSILQARYIVGTVIKERDTDIFYIGWDAVFDRKVQIQEYFPKHCATRSGKAELSIYEHKRELYQEGLELFYKQSRQMIRLYKEEDIITYHACFRENGTVYAIMDYSQDITLSQRLESHIFRVNEAEECLNDAIDAVQKAHRIGVFHGQITLDSFWEKPGGGLVLKDFGVPPIVSVEQGIGDYGNVGMHADVYGLAKLFCQLVTGKEIEDGEKLESELARKQVSLKKPVVEALKRALFHQTRTMDAFQKELWGRRMVPKSRKKKKNHGSLSLPRWVIPVAALLMAGMLIFTGLVATGKINLQMQLGESHLGKGKVRVPNLINEDKEKAERLLKKIGLSLKEGEKTYSEEIEENKISSQDYKENTTVDKGTPITVNFSLGKEKGAFPQVVGVDRDEARKLLEEARFTNISEKESQDDGVFNSVLSASEKSGDNVELTKEIILTICKNETAQEGDASVQIEVPDVAGKGKEDAEAALEEAGFSVQWAEEFSEQDEGSILEQNPAAGEKANKGSIVKVHISIGPEKLYMINVELKTLEEAEKVIGELGLELGEVKKDYSETVESGKVISQSIPKDTEINPGDKVDLVISLGEKPAPVQKEETKPAQPQKPKPTQPQTSALPPAVLPSSASVPETSAPAEEEKTSGEKNTTGGVSGVGGSGAQGKAPTETATLPSNEQPAPTPAPTSSSMQVETQAPPPAPTLPPVPTPDPVQVETQAPTPAPDSM